MEINPLFEIPHIRLTQTEPGMYCLVVDSTELNDYVEDFLWDDFEYQTTSVSLHNTSALATYYNYLDAGIPTKQLVDALNQIDLNEVARIVKLNNL